MTLARTLRDAAQQARAMPPTSPMIWTPASLAAARTELRLSGADLGRLLRLPGRDPGRMVKQWEAGAAPIPGPVTLALEFILAAKRRRAPPIRPDPGPPAAPGRPPAAQPPTDSRAPASGPVAPAIPPAWLDLTRVPLLADEHPPKITRTRRRGPAAP
jgi:hypothetical protein